MNFLTPTNLKSAVNIVQKTFALHSPTMLTAIGAAGVVTTAVLTSKATVQSIEELNERYPNRKDWNTEDFTKSEKVAHCWRFFIPPVLSGVGTIAAVIGSHTIHTSRRAALLSAYSLTEKAYADYREKVKEQMGEKKEARLRDEINEDLVRDHPVSSSAVHVINGKESLVYESITGRYFMSDMNTLRAAENKMNEMINRDVYVSLNNFFEAVGLPTTIYGDEVGWNTYERFKLFITTTMSDDNRPCLCLDYNEKPFSDYRNFH